MRQGTKKTRSPQGAYRCEAENCGGYTHVLKVVRLPSGTVQRIRKCNSCGCTATTHEKRHGDVRTPY